MIKRKPNILVVSGFLEYPTRKSVSDLIFAFHRNRDCYAYFYSIEQGPIPSYLKKVRFDLVVFTTVLLGERWGGQQKMYDIVYRPLEYLKKIDAVKVVHPQDEWIHTTALNNFIIDFEISHVFSVAPKSEWGKIYDKVDSQKVKFHSVLTGYLSDQTIKKSAEYSRRSTRKIDIGYRAFKSPPWLGRHGFLKTLIAEIFKKEAPQHGFTVDISTEEKDTIKGDSWLKFLADCKYFIGVEGGSTVIDREGSIYKKGLEYEREFPRASFEDFEKNCFPEMDGNLNLVALSPRHFECCATSTCQILVEGEYNGVLSPGIHYIALKKDFSNLEHVFKQMRDQELRRKITKSAYNDIVMSKKYSYHEYARYIISKSLSEKLVTVRNHFTPHLLLRNKLSERRFWQRKKKAHLRNER